MRSADLLILGAGPAGLAASLRAARAGLSVVVLEREERVGGLTASFKVGGITVDHGSHRLHPSIEPRILQELSTLMGEDLQLRGRSGRIRLEGRWIGFPLRPLDLLTHLPPGFALAALRDAALSQARRPREDSFAEVLRAGLGPTMCERFYFPYARKIWGLQPEEIDGEQARRRVSGISAAKLLKRLTQPRSKGGSTFYYPRHGFGQISECLAAAAVDEGAEVRLGTPVTRVDTSPGEFQVWTDTGERVQGTRLWSTIPLPVLARLSDPPPPVKVLSAASSLSFRSMLLVYLILPNAPYTPYDAHYLPLEDTPVTRISEPANYRADHRADRTVLCAEIPCSQGDELWCSGDEILAEMAAEALRITDLPPATPLGFEVKRVPSAYPVYHRGYGEAFRRLDEWASSCDGLLTFGRQGLFAHNNSHHAMAMAWAAVDALRVGGDFDAASWAESRVGFQSHVVED